MKLEDFKKLVREIMESELQSMTNERNDVDDVDLYDIQRDFDNGALDYEDYVELMRRYAPRDDPPRRYPGKARVGSYPPTPERPATPAPAADKNAMLQQKIKYKDEDGTEREATVKSLLGYAKDHPGRKLAARVYAQFMAKSRQGAGAPQKENSEEKMCEGEGCLDEKSVPQPYDRKKARKMTKSQVDNRKRIGRNMLANEKTVSKFRKKFGDDWKDHLWAAASSAAFRQSGSSKSDDTRKK
jgi:hypothetical protein